MHPLEHRSSQADVADHDRRHSGAMPDPGDVTVGPDGGIARRVGGAEPWRRRLTVWRSPADQPRLGPADTAGLAAVAGVAYGWRMGSSIEIYYAAAARSMSMSWHDFVYGAFDPAGTISVDKLPGRFVGPGAVGPALRASTPGPSPCPRWWRASSPCSSSTGSSVAWRGRRPPSWPPPCWPSPRRRSPSTGATSRTRC